MKNHQFEEITAALSIIITLLAYKFGIDWLFYIFFVKSCFDSWFAFIESCKSAKENNNNQHPEQCNSHFVGRTFYALYQSESNSMHNRMMFVREPLEDNGFYEWVQSEGDKIKKDYNTRCVVMDCKVI